MANQAIRQEINLTDVTTVGTGTVTADHISELDTTKYSGSPTYWFEACFNGAASNTGTIQLRDLTGATNVATLTGATSATFIVSRIQFTPTAGAIEYGVQLVGDGTRSQQLNAARIIILQSEAGITKTSTQIEVASRFISAFSNTTVADINNLKFWKYVAANWDGTLTFSAEIVWNTSSKNTCTITLCRTSDNAANVTIVNAGSNTAINRTRVSFTPVDGETYKIRSLGSTSKSTYRIYGGKIIVNQIITPSAQISENNTDSSASGILGGTGGAENSQAVGQSFTTTGAFYLTDIQALVSKTTTPTDNLYLELASGSIDGSTLATSSLINGASISGTQLKTFVFPTILLDAATKYYFRILRDGARDSTNFFNARIDGTSAYPDGGRYLKQNGVWGTESATVDVNFIVNGVTDPITKLEPQYLLLNSGDAGTGVQNKQTTYNSAEWDDGAGTTTLTHLMDSDNASNSAKIVTAAGADTGSSSAATGTLQIESGAFTLIDATKYDTNVTNSTGAVNASRIKVVYAFVAASVRRIFVTGG